ncbi:MAG: hypothetical protein GF400_03585 [Candidatus Eisenbacteria bacterium]|nr:hypothetical protein [Candidatus Eisenbacteria bacterium]
MRAIVNSMGQRRGAAAVAALVCVLLTAALAALPGCFGSSTGPDDDPEEEGYEYTPRTSPANVIAKLVEAYGRTDAEAYLDCLAEDFVFFLNPDDVTPGGGLPEQWGKDEEEMIHQAMFSDTLGVDGVSLTMTNVSATYDAGEDPGDPSDDTWEYLEDPDLRVMTGNLTLLANGQQLFTVAVDPDTTGPGGETLWEIADWSELSEAPDLAESSTWGSIKSLYR